MYIIVTHPQEQSTSACWLSLTRCPPLLRNSAPSTAPTVPNDQQDPHTDWSAAQGTNRRYSGSRTVACVGDTTEVAYL